MFISIISPLDCWHFSNQHGLDLLQNSWHLDHSGVAAWRKLSVIVISQKKFKWAPRKKIWIDFTGYSIVPNRRAGQNKRLIFSEKKTALLLGISFHFRPFIKVGFFQKVTAKFSNLSKWHSCEPKIVLELLFPVHVINKILVIFWYHLAKKSAYHEL